MPWTRCAGEDWRAASAVVSRATPADGAIVYTSTVLRAFQYAQSERGVPMRGALVYPHRAPWRGDQHREPVPPGFAERAARTYARLWVVLSHRQVDWEPVVLTPLRRFYNDAATEHLGEVDVHEMRLRAVVQPRK